MSIATSSPRRADCATPPGGRGLGPRRSRQGGRCRFGVCGIPGNAVAVAINVTAVSPSAAGRVTVFPGDAALPPTSTLNFPVGQTRANNAILQLAGDGSGRLAAVAVLPGGGTVDLVLDVVGWFE